MVKWLFLCREWNGEEAVNGQVAWEGLNNSWKTLLRLMKGAASGSPMYKRNSARILIITCVSPFSTPPSPALWDCCMRALDVYVPMTTVICGSGRGE